MRMRLFLLGCLIAFVLGCNYSVPLTYKPRHKIDPQLAGLWLEADTNAQPGKARLLVLVLDEYHFLVSYRASTNEKALLGKVCLADSAAGRLAQIQWLGSEAGSDPHIAAHPYQFAAVTCSSNLLQIRLLNPEVVRPEHCTTPKALAKAIKKHSTHPQLFLSAQSFTRESR